MLIRQCERIHHKQAYNKLVYILSFADETACSKAWEDFKNDLNGGNKGDSSHGGELVVSIKSVFMHILDFYPDHLRFGDHIFELQTYKSIPDNLKLLLQMFRQRHVKLYGMNTIKY